MKKYIEINTNEGIMRGFAHIPQTINEVIIFYHGFTGNSIEPNSLYTYLADYLESLGYLCIRFDFLGNGNSDNNFNNMTFSKYLKQAEEIYKYTKANFKNQINILGLSMGGVISNYICDNFEVNNQILLSPALNFKELIQANFEIHEKRTDNSVDVNGYLLSKDFLDDILKYDFTNIKKDTVRTCIIAGTSDYTCPVSILRKYKNLYKNNEFHIIKEGDHTYNNYDHRMQIYEIIRKFLTV